MAEQDITDLAGTADGNTAWGADMRGAMTTLALLDAVAATGSRRTLGTGAQQAAPGNHTHLSTAVTDFVAAVRAVPVQFNAQTGAAYTLVLADAEKVVERNNSAANTVTVPTNATVPFPIGTSISITQLGAGLTTINGAGVALRSRGGALRLAGQYGFASMIKRATDEWYVTGDLIP